MKKTVAILLILSGIVSKNFAQEIESKSALKINPLSLLLATGSVFYEHKLDQSKSLQLGAAYTGMKISGTGFSGFAVTPEIRFYANQRVMNAFYFAPFLRYQNFTIKDDEGSGSLSTFGGGLLAGRQWTFKKGFVLDLFAGPSFASGNVKVDDGQAPEISAGIEGLSIRGGITLGFSL